uniref:CSON011790 protein n=1 Tax=Culicoides sonorensis TaxID=179676 RepID=A0A336KNR0_CULSO
MVKLYSISIFYKGLTEAKVLSSAYDLSSFSFFQRGSVQEFIGFASKTIVERTTVASRQSVKQDVYMCHVYVRADNLAAILIADHEYPQRVAHTLLTKILDDFTQKVPSEMWPTGNESTISFNLLPGYLQKYQDPRQADALTKIQDDLDETKIILKNTIEAVLERGEKLDDLVTKSEDLSNASKAFYRTAKKTNSCCSFS